jgi:alkylhydroperoxidase family enzyme
MTDRLTRRRPGHTTGAGSSTARISLDPPNTLTVRLAKLFAHKQYGVDMQPLLAVGHHGKVLRSIIRFETGLARWSRLDPHLKHLASAAAAAKIGCSWCMDFGDFVATSDGMEPRKFEDLPQWRTSEAYSPLERKVLEYSEAMTATPPAVTDEMVAGLREELDNAQLVELTAMISVENQRSRTNSALGLTSQGFKDHCEVPPR